MIRQHRKIFLFLLFMTGIAFMVFLVDKLYQNKQNKLNIEEIKIVFNKIDSGTNEGRLCGLFYENGMEPDIDNYNTPVIRKQAIIDKDQIIELLEIYSRNCDEDKKEIERINSFLEKGLYSIHIIYSQENSKIKSITCLIWNGNKYLLFPYEKRDE